MLEILQFIFQDFWHWIGALIMLGVIVSGIGGFIKINVPYKRDGDK